MRPLLRLSFLLFALLLGACVAPQPKPPPDAAQQATMGLRWAARQIRLAQVTGFALEGRIGVSGVAGSGALSWRQTGDQFELVLSGGLGVSGLRISGTPGDYQAVTKEGTFRREEADARLQRQLGAAPPVADLRWWVLGLSSPQGTVVATQTLDLDGRLKTLEQDGWQLEYSEYQMDDSIHLDLPRRIVLSRGDVRLRLVIDRWSGLATAG